MPHILFLLKPFNIFVLGSNSNWKNIYLCAYAYTHMHKDMYCIWNPHLLVSRGLVEESSGVCLKKCEKAHRIKQNDNRVVRYLQTNR